MTRPNPQGPGRGRPPKPKEDRRIEVRGWISAASMRVLEIAVDNSDWDDDATKEIRALLEASRKRHEARNRSSKS